MNKLDIRNTYSCSKREYMIVSFLILLSFTIKLLFNLKSHIHWDWQSYGYSEFLINFQGGFVRRGLIGEILLQLFKIHSYPLKAFIFFACYGVFFGLLIFFIRKFQQYKYCWWLLFSPLFFNFSIYIIRKDYILYAILIGVIYLLRSPSTVKKISACMLVSLGLFVHEAFLFWGFAVYSILMLSNRSGKILNYILVCIPFIIAIVLGIFNGSQDTPHTIISSWNSVLPESPLHYIRNNSIGAIGWDSLHTFKFHLRCNLSTGGSGIILLPLFCLIAYYFLTNFLFVFKNNNHNDISQKLEISLLFSSLMICLIPMLTILSCDTGRIFQYATMATFSTFLILPKETVLCAYPKWYKKHIRNFNNWLNNFIPPNKGIMIIILLMFGISNAHFQLYSSWRQSVIGSIVYYTLLVCRKIYFLIFA